MFFSYQAEEVQGIRLRYSHESGIKLHIDNYLSQIIHNSLEILRDGISPRTAAPQCSDSKMMINTCKPTKIMGYNSNIMLSSFGF